MNAGKYLQEAKMLYQQALEEFDKVKGKTMVQF
jgi:hypothetical protein